MFTHKTHRNLFRINAGAIQLSKIISVLAQSFKSRGQKAGRKESHPQSKLELAIIARSMM